jgi:hypothetical protein
MRDIADGKDSQEWSRIVKRRQIWSNNGKRMANSEV